MIKDIIFNPLTFNPLVWVKALGISFKHCEDKLPSVLGKFEATKSCFWVASATHALFNKIGISSVLTGGSAAWRYNHHSNQTLIYTNWCVNLPQPGKDFAGHCWVETNDYIVDFCDFWFYKEKKKGYKPTSFFIRKEQLLTLNEIKSEQKEGCYYSSIPGYIKSIEISYEAQDKKCLEIVSEPILSVTKNLFINFALLMYMRLYEEYLIAETI